MTEPESAASSQALTRAEHEELVRARARIRDLEAALEAAQRKIEPRPDAALARSEGRFRALIDNLHVGVVVQGPKSEILLFNARALELLGLSEDELLGRTSFDPGWEVVREDGSPYLPEERPVAMVLTTRAPIHGVVMGIRRPRTADLVWLLVNAMPERDPDGEVVQVVATLSDVTERKLLDDSLRQNQKLDSLGLLAGGIAHDFNNLLTVITSSTELARMRLPDDPERDDYLEEVLGAAERATSLTRQLLSFARRRAGTPRRIDVGTAIAQFEKLLRRLLHDGVELELELPSRPVCVKIDQGQLEQVLVNLVVNARDAMPEGGRLTIAVDRVEPGRAPAPLDERATARLRIRDEGVGMSAEVLARVFEPLFTTKAVGHGTGLGMATVLGIVRESGGQIQVDSEPSRGTEVSVFLPLLPSTGEPAADSERSEMGLGHGESVLVVDDDPVLRSVTARMLADLGYRSLEAEDGFAALDMIERRAGALDLLFTDVVMPRMGGLELASRVRQRWPHVRVLACSGHADDLDAAELDGTTDGLLAKPFNMARLGRAVADVLAG